MINDAGQVVGFSDVGSIFTRAILYSGGVLIDLNLSIVPQLGEELTGAAAIIAPAATSRTE